MKNSVLIALTLGTALILGASGCKHGPVGDIPIPGSTRIGKTPQGSENQLPPGFEVKNPEEPTTKITETGIEQRPGSAYEIAINGPHDEDYQKFAEQTVHFDTDSSVIKSSEQGKLGIIADYLKQHQNEVLRVEGYCDERGTEGYNLALGDRRALAIREYLATLGVEPGHIGTVSLGEAKPVDTGHNETAWKLNRRGVSVLIIPKQ